MSTSQYNNTASSPTDQRLFGTESPKSFVDLDNVNEQDVSLYDQNANIKEEKLYVDCNSGAHTQQHFQFPLYDYSIDLQNLSPPIQPDFADVKLETPEPDFTETFGQTIVFALKREINEVCKALGIAPGN